MVHTRESHAADLSDCPPAKRLSGAPNARIGDAGPMGRILIRGEPGNAIIEPLAPIAGELVIDKPGKGAFYATRLGEELAMRGITHLVFAGVTTEVCVQTSMREANDRGYDSLLDRRRDRELFPRIQTGDTRHGPLARRHCRLDRAAFVIDPDRRKHLTAWKSISPKSSRRFRRHLSNTSARWSTTTSPQ